MASAMAIVPTTSAAQQPRADGSVPIASLTLSTGLPRGGERSYNLTSNQLSDYSTNSHSSQDGAPAEWAWLVIQRKRRERHCIRLLLYGLLVVIFTVVTQMVRPIRATFTVQDALLEHTAREPLPQSNWGKTFYDISDDADWWAWVETVLLPTILSNQYYNGDSVVGEWGSRFLNTVSMYNTQTATVRFRQARVTDDSCDTPAGNSELSRPCWGHFTTSRQFKESFGNEYGNTFLRDLNAVGGKDGFGSSYGTEAHVVDLPLDKGQALARAASMKSGLWITEGTRALSVETSWYNANLDLSTYLMWHLDISPGGRFQPHVVVHSCRLNPYAVGMDYARAVLEGIFVLLLVMFFIFWFVDWRNASEKQVYITSIWTWCEMLNLLCYMFIVLAWLIYMLRDKKPFQVVSSAVHNRRPDLSGLADHYSLMSNAAAFNIIFSFVKIFKHLQMFQSLGGLWRTLEVSVVDTATFFTIFLLFTCGFAFAGHWMFGFYMVEFHDWVASFSTLFHSLMGGLPYDLMSQAAPINAVLFTVGWVLMMVMVIVTMFIAILTHWHAKVAGDEAVERKRMTEEVGPNSQDGIFRLLWRHVRTRLLCTGSLSMEEFGPESSYGSFNALALASFDKAVSEVGRGLAHADLNDVEHVREALLSGARVKVYVLALRNFHGDTIAAADFARSVCRLADSCAGTTRSQSMATPVWKFAAGEEKEQQEQDRLQKLQATVQRMEEHMKQLRAALHESSIAPTASGQALEGYHVDTIDGGASGGAERTQARMPSGGPQSRLPGSILES